MATSPPVTETEVKPPPTSLGSRLANVFAAPGEVFDEVRQSKSSVGNWLLPVLLLALAGMISAVVIFSQPEVIQTIHEQQQKAFDKQVSAGKLTQEQADRAAAAAEKFSGPAMMKIFGAVGAGMTSFFSLFWWAFLMWVIARLFLKAPMDFMKAVEAAGLASMIDVLGTVVKTLLIVMTGNLYAAPGLVLLVKHFDPQNPLHIILSLINVMTFWLLAVRAIGLAKLTGATFVKTSAWIFGVWMVITGIMAGFGFAIQAMFAK